MRTRQLLYTILLPTALLTACKRSTFLDAKPNSSVSVPTSITDCQALMDNDVVMNGYSLSGYPSLGQTGSDDYYVSNAFYSQYTPTDRNAVIWAADIYADPEVNDWDLPYRTILYSKVALEALGKLHPAAEDQQGWNNAEGSALFFQGFAYFQLAQIFAKPYSAGTLNDPGLPLRKTTDIDEKFMRAPLRETYDTIISSLSRAIPLLPDTPLSTTRPSKPAAYAMLARVYLSMGNYPTALLYADSCLQIKHVLTDYNTIDQGNIIPFTRTGPEVIFGAAMYPTGPCATGRSFVDTTLLASYQPNDMRKILFFKGERFFGMYDEDGYAFCGLATDEIYLTRAECYARTGNIDAAMNDLDSLMIKRMSTGTFTPYTATDATDALRQILQERRKELLYRGLRWTDLRRLNMDAATAATLTRTVAGTIYTLSPNSARYVYQIPDEVINFNKPNILQNDTR
ncbi:MAG TPA: RagB/SusD family nutrient uptake outer membrane protein [Puia sp.]|nr:RagB/SusD family nutrient uptake outer membrane protein [Puia sp.]